MQSNNKLNFLLTLVFGLMALHCSPGHPDENLKSLAPAEGEIIFYSNGPSFSPVITLQGPAEVTWTWADSTTSNALNPTKNYGSAQLRPNSLSVNPWSALRRINIGYDAGDGGSKEIEMVPDQRVSRVDNLETVAPYLVEWCSSYNELTELDFSNFVRLQTIECYLSTTLEKVTLTNTPQLRRGCFEDNHLERLDLRGCNLLEDLRGAYNNYPTILLPPTTQNIWHLCVGNNPQMTTRHMFNDLSEFPNLIDLIISDTNQAGALIIPRTAPKGHALINAERNSFTSLDLRGALQNSTATGFVFLPRNLLTEVHLEGCIQITTLDLRDNKLSTQTIDQILQQVDDFQTSNGVIDLRENQPPSAAGRATIERLRQRGWTVTTDPDFTSSASPLEAPAPFKLVPHSSGRLLQVQLDPFPGQQVLLEIHDTAGRKILDQLIHQPFTNLTLPPSLAGVYLVSLRTKHWISTQKLLL